MIEKRIRALIESLGYLWSRNAKRLWSFVIRVGKLSESGSNLVHYTGQTDTDFNTNNGHLNRGWSACAQIPIHGPMKRGWWSCADTRGLYFSDPTLYISPILNWPVSSVYLKFQQEAGKLIWRRVLPAFMPPRFNFLQLSLVEQRKKNVFKKTSTNVIPCLYGRFNPSKICPTFLADQSDSASRVHRFIWSTLSPNLEVITLVMLSYKYLFSYTCRCS